MTVDRDGPNIRRSQVNATPIINLICNAKADPGKEDINVYVDTKNSGFV